MTSCIVTTVEGVGTLLAEEMKKRIMVLDGAMGTMIQTYKFEEEDFRGKYMLNVCPHMHVCACMCVCECVHVLHVHMCLHACTYVCIHACICPCDMNPMALCRGGV